MAHGRITIQIVIGAAEDEGPLEITEVDDGGLGNSLKPRPGSTPISNLLQFENISAATVKIRPYVKVTPCTKYRLSEALGIDVYFKKDFLQYTGSFKERGCCYAMMMLPQEKQNKGVIAASAGNHAQSLSYYSELLGIPVTVIMPITAPIRKIQRCERFGAKVIVQGENMAEAKGIATQMADEEGLTFIHAFDDLNVMAGQGTIGLEILTQIPDVQVIVVPVGGGGLISGVIVAVKSLIPGIKIIGVESENCPGFTRAIQEGHPTEAMALNSLADGLAEPTVGSLCFEVSSKHIDQLILVKESSIASAILHMAEKEKCILEGAGVIGVAALLAGQLNEFKGKKFNGNRAEWSQHRHNNARSVLGTRTSGRRTASQVHGDD